MPLLSIHRQGALSGPEGQQPALTRPVAVIAIFAVATAVRLAAVLASHGHGADLQYFRWWGTSLVTHGLSEFYENEETVDHLPGDLYIHAALAWLYSEFISTDLFGASYGHILRITSSLFDVVTAWVSFHLVRKLASDMVAVVVAALILFNPGAMIVSSAWGQWDSYTVMLLVIILYLVTRWPDHWYISAPIAALVVCTKPNLVIPIAIITLSASLATINNHQRLRAGMIRATIQTLYFTALTYVCVVILLWPFSVTLPPFSSKWSYFEIVNVALSRYDRTWLGASNFWTIRTRGVYHEVDTTVTSLGLSFQMIGIFALLVALAYTIVVLILMWRASMLVDGTLWALTFSSTAMFMLPTRVHERYLLPGLIFCLILYASSRFRPYVPAIALVLTVGYSLNLAAVYYIGIVQNPPPVLLTAALLNAAAFVALAVLPIVIMFQKDQHRWVKAV